MTTYAADRPSAHAAADAGRRVLARGRIALLVATASWIALALLNFFATLTPDGHDFRHTADYWLTGVGILGLPALFVFLTALHTLHDGRDGRLGRAGLVLTGVALAAITGDLVYNVAAATTEGTGPLYPVAALASDLGMLLYCIGAYRARLLPRPLAAVWPVAWFLGGLLPVLGPAGGEVLLVAVYVSIAATFPRRVAARS